VLSLVFNMGCGCVFCGLVCSTSSGFSSGLFFSVGVFGLRFPSCVCVCARARGFVHLIFQHGTDLGCHHVVLFIGLPNNGN